MSSSTQEQSSIEKSSVPTIPVFLRKLRKAAVAAGCDIRLRVAVGGQPRPTLQWYHNDEPLTCDDQDYGGLWIRDCQQANGGLYTCVAVNQLGEARTSAVLAVLDLGEDSDNTEDESGEPHISMETQKQSISPLGQAVDSQPTSSVTTMVSHIPCYGLVVEREMRTLGCRAPGLQDPLPPDRPANAGCVESPPVRHLGVEALVRASQISVYYPAVGSEESMSLASDYYEDSSDVSYMSSYMSVEKHQAEAPMSDLPLKDAVVAAGLEGMPQCIFKENPVPQDGLSKSCLTITRPVQNVNVKAGEVAVFECHMAGPQDLDVDWLANGKLIQPAQFDCKMQFNGHKCCLLLKSVHEDDSGKYTCKLSSAKEELACTANLLVIPSKEPLFTWKLKRVEVIEGLSARFDCKVSGSPPPEVSWTHCEQPVMETDNIHILKENGRHSLLITHVTRENEGFYTAVACNVHGEAENSAELLVQESRPALSTHMSRLEKMPSIPEEPEVFEGEVEFRAMPDFIKPLSDLEVIEGKEAILKCRVTGLPYPTITWYHNSKKIVSSDDRKMAQYRDVHSLVIRSVCHGHSGVYKSVISNKVGKAACYAHLYVADVLPEPPDGPPIIESVTGRTILLSWKRPKSLDSSIDPDSLMYAVQQQTLGSIQWITIASTLKDTSFSVTSLNKGVCYSFRVLSTTGKAFSKPSQPTDLVQLIDKGQYLQKAPIILDKPDIVYVVENQPVTITVTLNHVTATPTWKRRGVVLIHRPGVLEMTMPDDDQHALHIAKIKSSTDVGHLIFMANNQYGSDLCTLQLVMAVPPAFEIIMEDLDVCLGETSCFFVIVDGKPDPDILWYKDSILLAEGSHFTYVYDDKECSLMIYNAQPEDSGVYTCTAKNLAGSVSCKAELTVHTAKNVEEEEQPIEDKSTILRWMRRLTDYYDIHKEIDRGAFSYVKKVTQKKDKIDYAAKFISVRAKRKTSALREMALLSELDHEKILYFHDAFEKKHVVVIITELCHEQLLERITKRITIMESEVQSIIQQLLKGIDYLHQKNIVHLDIKPENILMADRRTDVIRICDFGNAVKVTPSEAQYCKYGTPEFIAPEIVNQSPISKLTDIWPVGVITYLCLTGVSPFAGENDRDTLLNIRNYNVAFEERMFKDLCREAKGFIIKLLVAETLRPDSTECLDHSWFRAPTKGRSISTTLHKQVLARRKWQCSLIRYKSKMMMRSIPELLDDSLNHVSLAVPRNFKEDSPPLSSSSDEDIDELPFIPMPLTIMFSGSRMSLTEIHDDDDENVRESNELYQKITHEVEKTGCQPSDGQKGVSQLEIAESAKTSIELLQKGSTEEAQQVKGKSRRALIRRGSSADSALLHITPEYSDTTETTEKSQMHMKKAVSMELPNRSNSPQTGKLINEDYALKLQLMRQRLLRGGSIDKNMSGLRGPLLETLGVDDKKQTASLDHNLGHGRFSASGLPRAFSTDFPKEHCSKLSVFKKSASFSEEDSESIPLHRRFGAPLEIPFISADNPQKAIFLAPDQTMTDINQPKPNITSKPPTLENKQALENKQVNEEETIGDIQNMISFQPLPTSDDTDKTIKNMKHKSQYNLSGKDNENIESTPDILPHDRESNYSNIMQANHKEDITATPSPLLKVSQADAQLTTKHPAVFAKRACTPFVYQPATRSDIKNIDSEKEFEARFKKKESSLTRGLKQLTRTKSEEKTSVLPRKAAEEVYRPGAVGAPLEFVPITLQKKSKSVQDLREVEKDSGFGIIGRFSMRIRKMQFVEKKEGILKESDSAASKRRVTWALGRSKSLDKREVNKEFTKDTNTEPLRTLEKDKFPESPVLALKHKFESKISEISDRARKSRDRKDCQESKHDIDEETLQEEKKQGKKNNDSPVLEMQKKPRVCGFALRKRSQSEERVKTPLVSPHHHSKSDGLIYKNVDIPENQLVSQTASTKSKESLDTSSAHLPSIQSSQTPERDCRSRWDRWGLSRSRRDRTQSKSNAPSTPKEDFPPVFHIRLKDHVLVQGDPVTLCCLPAGSPEPQIVWKKDKKPLEICDRISLMACPDGRQLLMIMNTCMKDAGLYECLATNNLASTITSCTISLACVPKCPGTPTIPQIYNNTALVIWKPADTKVPCTYTLERKSEGDDKWLVLATGLTDCFYNTSDFPSGSTVQFRVACVNIAGQGPYSNVSERVGINIEVAQTSESGIVMAHSSASAPVVEPSVTLAQPNVFCHISATSSPLIQTASSTDSSPSSGLVLNTTLSTIIGPSNLQSVFSPFTDNVLPTSMKLKTEPSDMIDILSKVPVFYSNTKKSLPSVVVAKPACPINVASPNTQIQTVSPMPCKASPLVGRPISSAPTFLPALTSVTPTSVSPLPVDSVSSIGPVRQKEISPTTETPAGREVPSSKTEVTLRQAVPQKPYTFLDETARGRFGVIKDCCENATGKMFMAKIIPYDLENKQTVLLEYEILKSLHSQRIMALHEAYITPCYLVLITESCTGKEILYHLIDRFRYSEDDVVGYIVQILQGLEYLHNHRILHLDIKPDNIIVTNLSTIKIIDFGSAQSFNPLSLRQYSKDLGTLEYTAPEILKGNVVGPSADIWSLGILSYIMLSGRLPYYDKDPQQTETKIHAAKFDSTKLYPNVSQSAFTFLKKTLNGCPWSRPTIKDCFIHTWLQDSYLMKLRRQTLTFSTTQLIEFLEEQRHRRVESATQHKVLLRVYQSGPPSPATPTMPSSAGTL